MFLRNPAADGIVVLLVVLLFFGPKRLPQLTRSVAESIKELKSGIKDAPAGKPASDGTASAVSTSASVSPDQRVP